jgi:hypothetical protein
MDSINLYVAFEEMKRISVAGNTFSIKFRKWNRALGKGGDIVKLKAARFRSKASDEKIKNASYKLFLTDTETGKPMVCWQCLVVEFNGKKTIL